MKKIGFASVAGVVASGFAAALFGLAAPASADVGHNQWVHENQQHAETGSAQVIVGDGR